MIKPAGETRGVGLGAAVGDDVSEDCVGVGAAFGFTSVEASGTGFMVSERDHVSNGLPFRLRLSHARKATNAMRLIRTISRVFVRRYAGHLIPVKSNPQKVKAERQ
jgi:hypothetical protein